MRDRDRATAFTILSATNFRNVRASPQNDQQDKSLAIMFQVPCLESPHIMLIDLNHQSMKTLFVNTQHDEPQQRTNAACPIAKNIQRDVYDIT